MNKTIVQKYQRIASESGACWSSVHNIVSDEGCIPDTESKIIPFAQNVVVNLQSLINEAQSFIKEINEEILKDVKSNRLRFGPVSETCAKCGANYRTYRIMAKCPTCGYKQPSCSACESWVNKKPGCNECKLGSAFKEQDLGDEYRQ